MKQGAFREGKPRIVLIEGADRTGKSTVARVVWKLIRHGQGRFGMPEPKHFDVPPEREVLAHFLNQLEAWKETAHGGFVLDRCHLSNFAYRGCLGGGVLDATGWSVVDNWFRQQRALLIMLVDDPAEIFRRAKKEKDPRTSGFSVSDWGTLQNRFNLGFHGSLIPYKGTYQMPQLVDGKKETDNLKTVLQTWLADEE